MVAGGSCQGSHAEGWSSGCKSGSGCLGPQSWCCDLCCGSFFPATQRLGNLVPGASCPSGSPVSYQEQRPAFTPLWALTASPPQVRLPTSGPPALPRVTVFLPVHQCWLPSFHAGVMCRLQLPDNLPHPYHFPEGQFLTGNSSRSD